MIKDIHRALVMVQYMKVDKGDRLRDDDFDEWQDGPSASFTDSWDGSNAGHTFVADNDCFLYRFRSVSDDLPVGACDVYEHEMEGGCGVFNTEDMKDFDTIATELGTNKEGFGSFLILFTVEYSVDNDGESDAHIHWRRTSLSEMTHGTLR